MDSSEHNGVEDDGRAGIRLLYDLSKEELIQMLLDDAKNWPAHDGLWFQAVERAHGMDAAIEADRAAWERFTVVEAQRIMERPGLQPGGGTPALLECLKRRFYARLNLQDTVEVTESRASSGCGTAGSSRPGSERASRTSRASGSGSSSTRSLPGLSILGSRPAVARSPDEHPEEFWCAWEFTVPEAQVRAAVPRR